MHPRHNANLETPDLHNSKAVELCYNVIGERNVTDEERAIALCWLMHLIGDVHQPCHSGSLYMAGVFDSKEGDRGANSIEIGNRPLHSIWDGLLGGRYEKGDVNRRIAEINEDESITKILEKTGPYRQSVVLAEGAKIAETRVYTGDVLTALRAVGRDGKLPPIKLSEEYLKDAGYVAQVRVAQAAKRLAELLNRQLSLKSKK